MQKLVRSARRTSLLQARLGFQQGLVTRASAQGEQGGGESVGFGVAGVNAEAVGQVPGIGLTGSPFPGVAAPVVNASSNKIFARLSNCPKYAFKSDILVYFEGCNLQPHQLVTIYDEKYRQRFVQLEFDKLESFRQAQRTIVRQGCLGGRYLKLDTAPKRSDDDDIHNVFKDFRGQSRFFQGYNLSSFSTRFLWVQKDAPAYVGRKVSQSSNPAANTERRTLVKFSSPLEASRALRANHGQFCLNKIIDLRFVQ